MLEIRKATNLDFERIMAIYRIAQDYMIRSGNPNQWGHSHPKPELIKSDLETGISYVIYDGTGIHGVFAMIEGRDPTYGYIEDGAWLNDDPYITIHRIASDGETHGIFKCAADYCKERISNVRVDTHEENATMQRQLAKNGFQKCGRIYLANGSPRIAYQWSYLQDSKR